ncbi:MAG: hypothetical protein FJ221_00380 [Lentisphaerae bacterium]|nr:hypothetical protein [Lentisphaerota bacterium]
MTGCGRHLAGLGLGLAAACAWAQLEPAPEAPGLGAGPQSGLRPGMEVGGFRLPDYAEDGTLQTQLFGEHALALSNGLIEIRGLRIEMYKDGQVETRVTSPHCLYDRERQSAGSTSSVRITRGDVVITGDDYLYSPRRQRFEIHTNARVVLRDVRGLSGRKGPPAAAVPTNAAPAETGVQP